MKFITTHQRTGPETMSGKETHPAFPPGRERSPERDVKRRKSGGSAEGWEPSRASPPSRARFERVASSASGDPARRSPTTMIASSSDMSDRRRHHASPRAAEI